MNLFSSRPNFYYLMADDSDAGIGVGTPITTGGIPSGVGLGFAHPIPRTILPISRYAEIMGISMPHFWQMDGPLAPLRGNCDDLWDQPSREFLAWSMIQAEEMIAQFLGYWPAPIYITNEQIPFNLPGVRGDWRNAEVETEWGRVVNYGTELLTLKEADAPVTYSNLDQDPFGRTETATIGNELYASLTACDNVCDVAVFFREEDGADDPADPRWEIRPLKIDIDDGLMTIEGPASLFVKPELLSLTKQDCWGSDDPNKWKWNFEIGNLVGRVDVYCRTTSLATPATLQWDGVCGCIDVCGHRTQTACAYPTDIKRGFFAPRPATWNGTANIDASPLHAKAPESVLINYLAGHSLDTRSCRMNFRLERAIVKLTNALLPEPPCGFCDPAKQRWNEDRKVVDPLTLEAANMPWDLYTQGALDAWKIVKIMAMGKGGKMGRGYGG